MCKVMMNEYCLFHICEEMFILEVKDFRVFESFQIKSIKNMKLFVTCCNKKTNQILHIFSIRAATSDYFHYKII